MADDEVRNAGPGLFYRATSTDPIEVRFRYWANLIVTYPRFVIRYDFDPFRWLGQIGQRLAKAMSNPACRHDDCWENPRLAMACIEEKRAKRRAR